MNNKILLIPILIAVLSPSILFSLTDKEIEEIRKKTWCIRISVNVKEIYPHALQYAVFETDPVKIFKKHMMRVYKAGGKKPAKDRFMKDINMSVDWDMLFREITADNLSLLPLKTESNNPFSVRSNSDPESGKVWVVTKTAHKKDNTPVCWCIPVKVEKGKESDITIDMNNMFELEKNYDKMLNMISKK